MRSSDIKYSSTLLSRLIRSIYFSKYSASKQAKVEILHDQLNLKHESASKPYIRSFDRFSFAVNLQAAV